MIPRLTLTCLLMGSLLFPLLTLAQSPGKPTTATIAYGNNKAAGHYAAIRGIDLYYETYGKGKPVLFIHGNGGNIDDFTDQIPYFASRYRVIVPDSRAQGKSTDPGDSLTYDMMAEDLNALLNTLHLDSCYVIGWSDGGINGLLLAMRHPEKVKKLVITGANLWPDTTALVPAIYHGIEQAYRDLQKREQTAAVKNMAKLNRMMLIEPHITTEQLQAVQCPTLVISGDHDVIRPQHTLTIAESISKSYLWIVPNSGHSTLITYKNQFNQQVHTFFQTPYRRIDGFNRFH